MPTLFRLIFVLGALAAIVYGAMTAMVMYLQPHPHQISQTITLPSQRK